MRRLRTVLVALAGLCVSLVCRADQKPQWADVGNYENAQTIFARVAVSSTSAYYLENANGWLGAFDASGVIRGKVKIMDGPAGIGKMFMLDVGFDGSSVSGLSLKYWDPDLGEKAVEGTVDVSNGSDVGAIDEPVVYYLGSAAPSTEPSWPEIGSYENSQTIFARISESGSSTYLEHANGWLAAFDASGAVRGKVKIMEGPVGKMFSLDVGFDGASIAGLKLKYWDPDRGEKEVDGTVDVANGEDVGAIDDPKTYYLLAGSSASDPSWPEIGSYENSQTIFARICEIGSSTYLEHANGWLAAFDASGVIRGKVKIMEGPVGKMFSVDVGFDGSSVFGLTLKYWDPDRGEKTVDGSVDIKNGEDVGAIDDPKTFYLSTGAVNDPPWSEIGNYENSQTIFARVCEKGTMAYFEHANGWLAAFDGNGVVRGKVKIMEGPSGKMFSLDVGFDGESVTGMTLKYWDPDYGQRSIEGTVDIFNGTDIGAIDDPTTFYVSTAPQWPEVTNYENAQTIYARVYEQDTSAYLEHEQGWLGAFDANGVIRGKVKLMEGPACKMFALDVGFDGESVKGLVLKYWNPTGEEKTIEETVDVSNGSDIGAIDEPKVYNIARTVFTVTFQAGAHGTLSGETVQQVKKGEAAVAPQVTPEAGYDFTGWDKSFDNITSDLTVTAQWKLQEFVVTVDGVAQTYHYGDEVTLETTPERIVDYTKTVCTGWRGTGDVPSTGTDAQVTFKVTQTSSLTWLYETSYWFKATASEGYSVSVLEDGYAADPAGSWVPAGKTVVVSAVGYSFYFRGWRDALSGLTINGQQNRLELTMNEAHLVEAVFERTGGRASFGATQLNVGKGGDFVLTVYGGVEESFSSVKVSVSYGNAKSSDLDLKHATVSSGDGNLQTGIKFPLTLTWKKGDTTPKTITIPTTAGKITDAPKCLVWNLSDAVRISLGENLHCIGMIDSGISWSGEDVYVLPYIKNSAGGKPSGGASAKPNARTGVYKTLTLRASPSKGYMFAGWYRGDTCVSLDASFKVTPDGSEAILPYEARFEKPPTWGVGTFNGRFDDGSASVTMTITEAGKISGKVIVAGKAWSFSATGCEMTLADGEVRSMGIRVTAKNSKKTCALNMTITSDGVMGTAVGDDIEASVTLWRDDWKDTGAKQRISPFVGLYTVQLEGEGAGYGYASLKIDAKGTCKATGKLPDGTSASSTLPLVWMSGDVPQAVWQIFPSSYKGGYVGGLLKWTANKKVQGEKIEWVSLSPTASSEYGEGFAKTMQANGAWYGKDEQLTDYYGTLAFSAVAPVLYATVKTTDYDDYGKKVTVSELKEIAMQELACWNSLTISPSGNGFAVDAGKATRPVQDKETKEWSYTGANDAALTFSFTKTTGIFKGSFTCWYDYDSDLDYTKGSVTTKHTSKKASFEGVMVVGEVLTGYYLWERQGEYEDAMGKTKTFKYKESQSVVFK